MSNRKAIIIGAGPAGLTAAYELLTRTDVVPIILEKSTYMGGISRTLNYKGNRIDIGGHRFFSKSDRVMQWWLDRLPLQKTDSNTRVITYQRSRRNVDASSAAPDPDRQDQVMLLRARKSRIYFLRKLFDYPISLSKDTLMKLGWLRTARIGLSYLRSMVFPIRKVQNLEQFFINRFGRELYLTFFKSYTEKVWGTACKDISAEWGQQRIKELSLRKTITHVVKKAFNRNPDLGQKDKETSLIEQFLYPKYGPGHMWETVAKEVVALGGQILTGYNVKGLTVSGDRILAVRAESSIGAVEITGDFFFSTMPVKELISALETDTPSEIREIGAGLIYRDFITVGLLLSRLKVWDEDGNGRKPISDNWIYVQEPDVLAGRIQIFNNWSPYMVADATKVWIGVEYFCYESDDLWRKSDTQIGALAAEELDKIGILDRSDVLDSFVFRMPKSYPAYFGTYSHFDKLREYVDQYRNLFLIGRNGMHKYNNQDHSMLTAMIAVDNIAAGISDKSNIWEVNTEIEYNETKRAGQEDPAATSA